MGVQVIAGLFVIRPPDRCMEPVAFFGVVLKRGEHEHPRKIQIGGIVLPCAFPGNGGTGTRKAEHHPIIGLLQRCISFRTHTEQ